MSQTHGSTDWRDRDFEEDTDEFIENRREELEAIAEGDYPFSEYAQRLLDSVEGGGD